MNITHANTLVAEVKALDVQIAALQAERATRIALLAAEAGHKPGKVNLGTCSFTVRENNTYDEAVMRDNLLPGQIRRVSVSKMDKAAVKRLYPNVYAMAQRKNGVSVSVG